MIILLMISIYSSIYLNLWCLEINNLLDVVKGHLSHYYYMYDLEVDAVLHLNDDRYALIKIKLGSINIDKGIKNLKKVQELIKKNSEK